MYGVEPYGVGPYGTAPIYVRPDPEFKPFIGPFPPSGPTTAKRTIPSYLYVQYADDDDLQAFVAAYNEIAQSYVDWFVNISLPVYTGLSGALLDWVVAGLYGMTRPSLSTGIPLTIGPINTVLNNFLPINDLKIITPTDLYATTDDVFKRIVTFNFFKGDGKVFTTRWLKRRVMRFLTGTDGSKGETDETYPISVTFGGPNVININLGTTRRRLIGGALIGSMLLNTVTPNQADTVATTTPALPLANIFKAAVQSGILDLPFEFEYVVNT